MNHRGTLVLGIVTAIATASFVLAHDGDPKVLDRRPAYPGHGWRNAERVDPNAAAQARATEARLTRAQSAQGASSQPPTQQYQTGTNFAHMNVTLLSWLSLPDLGLGVGGSGSSCFGYTSPSGREYALIGTSIGMSIVEVTQPGNPVIVAQIPGNQSLWRDMRTFGHYAYVGTENNGGIQVVDLANVDNGVAPLVNTVMTGGVGNTHTIAINMQSGYLYRAGGQSNGLRIYDLNADPVNPPFVGQWSNRYVHEAQIVSYPGREIAICCGGLNNGYADTGIDIVDVTNHAVPVSLLHVVYGLPGYSHQAWLSPDRQFLYHNDETDGRPYTRVFDATHILDATPTLPYLGEFQNGITVDHNLYTKDNLLFESNYQSGLRVFDRSSSSLAPTLIASFDTYPEQDGPGYNGLWNNYPYFASGTVVGSDLERGLFVWWVGAPPVTFTFPNGTPTAIDPGGQSLVVQIDSPTQGLLANSLKLWTSTGGAWTSTDLVALGGNRYAGTFAPAACGTSVQYYVSAQTPNQVVWTSPESGAEAPYSATVAVSATIVAAEDFETATGWASPVTGDTATAGGWVRADPVGTTAQPEDDHTSGAGVACWVTGNGTAGGAASAADVDGGFTTLLSRKYMIGSTTNPFISYWRWFSNDQGGAPNTDVLRVDVSNDDGQSWFTVETVGPTGSETAGGWYQHTFRVGDFVAPTDSVRLRFVASDLGVDSTVEAAIDDLQIVDAVCVGAQSFCAGDGSASACPCGNAGASGAGCASGTGPGVTLSSSGNASVGVDTLVLSASGLASGSPTLFFQGTNEVNGGLGAAFGDGLRCVGGLVVRLGTKTAGVSGTVTYPEAGDASVSVRGMVPSGATRGYQVWYRSATPFCTSATFNLSNGVAVSWGN